MDTLINFPVAEKRLKTIDGLAVPNKAIVRTDKNIVLGVMGEDYQLVPHQTVIDAVEKELSEELTNRKISICRHGAVMFAKYETPNIKAVEIRKGDVVRFGVEVFNSYDGSLPVGFMFVAMRLVCTNGMTIPKSIARISVKHTSGITLDNISKEFTNRVPLYMKTADKWREWSEFTPRKNRVNDFFKKHTGDRMKKIFEEKFDASTDKTLWGLYNSLTYYCTHEIKVQKGNEQNKRLAQFNFEKGLLSEFYNFNWSEREVS